MGSGSLGAEVASGMESRRCGGQCTLPERDPEIGALPVSAYLRSRGEGGSVTLAIVGARSLPEGGALAGATRRRIRLLVVHDLYPSKEALDAGSGPSDAMPKAFALTAW